MSHELGFERLVSYDPGITGITIDAEIKLGSASARFEAKIDTGSTFCIFARYVGEQLGIEIESGNPKLIATATGLFRVFGHNVTLITEEVEFDSEVFFAEDEAIRRNVLGRHGWLDRMIIGINDYDGELYLSRYK